jgi:hypothetical protein
LALNATGRQQREDSGHRAGRTQWQTSCNGRMARISRAKCRLSCMKLQHPTMTVLDTASDAPNDNLSGPEEGTGDRGEERRSAGTFKLQVSIGVP